jgi:glutamine amidotransferase
MNYDYILADSECAFALLLSKVCSLVLSLISHSNIYVHVQLPDPQAKSFTTRTLQQAMLDTIATLNLYAEEAGITEVS